MEELSKFVIHFVPIEASKRILKKAPGCDSSLTKSGRDEWWWLKPTCHSNRHTVFFCQTESFFSVAFPYKHRITRGCYGPCGERCSVGIWLLKDFVPYSFVSQLRISSTTWLKYFANLRMTTFFQFSILNFNFLIP